MLYTYGKISIDFPELMPEICQNVEYISFHSPVRLKCDVNSKHDGHC